MKWVTLHTDVNYVGLNPFLIRAFVQWALRTELAAAEGLNPFLIRAFVQ